MRHRKTTIVIGGAIGLVAAIAGASFGGSSMWPLLIAGVVGALVIIGLVFAMKA